MSHPVERERDKREVNDRECEVEERVRVCVPERDREKVTAREAVRDRERGGGDKE